LKPLRNWREADGDVRRVGSGLYEEPFDEIVLCPRLHQRRAQVVLEAVAAITAHLAWDARRDRISIRTFLVPFLLSSAISELIAPLPKDQLVSVYKNWMIRLNWVMKHRGEYYRK
jgi:hypothetical protein